MALTVVIREARHEGPELSITIDAPRVVIGRSRSCDVVLPDPTVSPRHASIRLQGGKNLVVDEGSTNGTLVGNVKLPPQTPRVVGDGDLIRVGRLWLELRFGAGHAGALPARQQAKALALDLLLRRLRDEGESLEPSLEVVAGPAAGARLVLDDPEREYRIGRGSDADLTLADPAASRLHASVARVGDGWRVRDHGSRGGSTLEGEPLGSEPVPWRDGAELALGGSVLVLRDPTFQAFDEALGAPDLKMRPAELAEPPPVRPGAEPEPTEPLEVVDAPDEAALDPTPTASESLAVLEPTPTPTTRRAGLIDALVALVAMSLLCLSLAGLWYVLG